MGPLPLWYFAWGIPWAVAAALYARRRSRNPVSWALLGFFFCFVALITLWIMGDGAWHLESGDAPDEDAFEGQRAGETTQMWRTPPASNRFATGAWWTSSDAGSLGHRSGDRSRRN